MEPGLMRHRLTVQQQDDEQNHFGEAENWLDLFSLWASVSPVSGRDFIAGFQEHSEVTHKITLRYNSSVRPHMRLKFGSRLFDILHIIDPWEQHREMTLMCREVIQ